MYTENRSNRPGAFGTEESDRHRPQQNGPGSVETRKIVIINGKGGCGKTTVATNLATWYANRGYNPALFDHDPQTSSMRWLRGRPADLPAVHGVATKSRQKLGVTRSWHLRVPVGTQRIINDTPAGLAGLDIADQVQGADCVLIPVLPSAIDIEAGADFIRDLLLMGRVRSSGIRVGIIANRIKSRTVALQALERFLKSLRIPVVARFRDSQYYVHAAEQGLGIGELSRTRGINMEVEQWNALFQWIESMPTIK